MNGLHSFEAPRDHKLLLGNSTSSDASSESSYDTASEGTVRSGHSPTSLCLHMANQVQERLVIGEVVRDFLDATMNACVVVVWTRRPGSQGHLLLDGNDFRALFMRTFLCYLRRVFTTIPSTGGISFTTVEKLQHNEEAAAPTLDMNDIAAYATQLRVCPPTGTRLTRCLLALLCDSELVPTPIAFADILWALGSIVAITFTVFMLGAYYGTFLVAIISDGLRLVGGLAQKFMSAVARGVGGSMCEL